QCRGFISARHRAAFAASRFAAGGFTPTVVPWLICPTIWFSEFLSSPIVKNISLFQKHKSVVCCARPVPARGALRDRHERWERDAMDASKSPDERHSVRTAKSRGPDLPTLGSTLGAQEPRGDGG